MALKFTKASATNTASGVKILVYGGAGAGKTVLGATMPRPVMLAAEPGALSLSKANLTRMFGPHPSITFDMPIIEIGSAADLTEAHQWLLHSHESKGFDSIVIDSLSEVAEVVLNNAKRQVKDPRMAYGELIEKMETLVRAYRDVPLKHVYMSAKMEFTKDEVAGTSKYGPAMPGNKFGQKLPYFFDEVFRLGTDNDEKGMPYRFLQTASDFQYEAKDRSGVLALREPAHLGAIIAKITTLHPVMPAAT